tara:strand:+ start:3048 stop:3245 length:198 start_codon:yes stop_codon:yes gene_type:complete
MKSDKFNPGDIVRISEKINDSRMPKSRMGFIINKVSNSPGTYHVQFANGEKLRFHHDNFFIINRR